MKTKLIVPCITGLIGLGIFAVAFTLPIRMIVRDYVAPGPQVGCALMTGILGVTVTVFSVVMLLGESE